VGRVCSCLVPPCLWLSPGLIQGCSLGLDISVSRHSFQMSRSRGNVERSRSRLGLKIKCLVLVSVSYHKVWFTSQYAQVFASLQNCTYIVLNARRLYCLLIHKSKRLTVCTTQDIGRQQSILQHVTLMPDVFQVCHSIAPCVKNGSCFSSSMG